MSGPGIMCDIQKLEIGIWKLEIDPLCPSLGARTFLFIGDIVGQPGRRVVQALVPGLREEFKVDVVVANGENSAGGSGITRRIADELFAAGVDVITSGDHLWVQREVSELLENEPRFLRPINYPPETAGHGSHVFKHASRPAFAVLNLQGRTFMANLENPFMAARNEVNPLGANAT